MLSVFAFYIVLVGCFHFNACCSDLKLILNECSLKLHLQWFDLKNLTVLFKQSCSVYKVSQLRFVNMYQFIDNLFKLLFLFKLMTRNVFVCAIDTLKIGMIWSCKTGKLVNWAFFATYFKMQFSLNLGVSVFFPHLPDPTWLPKEWWNRQLP